MAFEQIARPFIDLGIPVFPLAPGGKVPPKGLRFLEEATTDPGKVEAWGRENPDYNVALLADGEFCFLEFDVKGGMKAAAEEMGHEFPITRIQKSGRGFGHFIFRHTERSRALSNRSANLPDGKEWFSFRARNKYLVGAGSLHPSGARYLTLKDVDPVPVPDWVCDFVERHSKPPKTKASERKRSASGSVRVYRDFDFDAFCDHFGIEITGVREGVWHVVDECPAAGHRHEHSVLTAFYWNGESLGWSCFAQGCPGHDMTIGRLVGLLSREHGPYPGVIWDQEDDGELPAVWDVETVEDDSEPEAPAPIAEPHAPFGSPQENGSQGPAPELPAEAPAGDTGLPPCPPLPPVEDEFEDLRPAACLPAPRRLAIKDPENRQGIMFPGARAMHGKLKEIVGRNARLQPGWLYPALIAVASALGIEDEAGNVRSNVYVSLIGDVGLGKTSCMEAARRAILLPASEETVVEEVPSSDRGLANVMSDTTPEPRLLLLDEGRALMAKSAIKGSALPQMLNQLWSRTKAGVTDKKGRQPCYARLSILMNLTCKDPGDFATLFGAATVTGLADRFLYGYSNERVRYRPPSGKPEAIDPRPVVIPDWVWDAKDEWAGEVPERRRLTEHALRIALVTAAVNGDREITGECFEAALRFMEWQERLRSVYRPGVAETKEAECYEAVYTALHERHTKQKAEGFVHKRLVRYDLPIEEPERWRLLHFAQIVNSKSYYRKYAGLIDRVRKSMADNGIIEEVYQLETDERGREKRGPKTPFVRLRGKLK